MARWKRGEAEVEALIASGDLQKLTGAAASGERFLKKAVVTLETARSAVERDPDSAPVADEQGAAGRLVAVAVAARLALGASKPRNTVARLCQNAFSAMGQAVRILVPFHEW